MTENGRDCGIVFDEMSTEEARVYCPSKDQVIGTTTLPPSDSLATKAIVFMLVGIGSPWKQIVGYDFTGNSIPGSALKERVMGIMVKAEEINLKVHFITSDSGAKNQRMWKDFGIDFSRGNIMNDLSLVHPLDSSRRLEIIPDAVHVFKNLVHGWLNNVYLTLPEWYVELKKLPSSIVHRAHLKELVSYEHGNQLKMAYTLKEVDVNFETKMSSVDKMKVSNSTKFCNLDNASALRFVALEKNNPSLLATAAYLEDITLWYAMMTNRSEDLSLRLDNPDYYKNVCDHLNQTSQLIYDVRVGALGHWKPWKSALTMCTQTVLRLSDRLLKKGHKIVLTAKFIQDCLESVFSVVRFKQRRPTSLQFSQIVKIITLTQYMTKVPSSYYMDDQEHLVGLMDLMKVRRKELLKDKYTKSSEILQPQE
ncbi:uncharacterized protein LOC129728857 [Wyeomyia smithii]|uniref:uncharacterized protein LOC129728857 n=1 Tax=Wyeomyia smithii TaxID=174621 RepID=UPI002467E7EB|nr:uncharacterized protein LOC129728857 [Wyeomyia smithii]